MRFLKITFCKRLKRVSEIAIKLYNMSRIHFWCTLRFPEQILISKGIIYIDSIQCPLHNMFTDDIANPDWTWGLDTLCVDLGVTPAQCPTVIALTTIPWLLLCHHLRFFGALLKNSLCFCRTVSKISTHLN